MYHGEKKEKQRIAGTGQTEDRCRAWAISRRHGRRPQEDPTAERDPRKAWLEFAKTHLNRPKSFFGKSDKLKEQKEALRCLESVRGIMKSGGYQCSTQCHKDASPSKLMFPPAGQ